tara:strand:- start:118 stop:426 length:309 start_codon:yes stop_codon:yes gene_type:complete
MTYVFDIDGTICDSSDGYENSKPIWDRIKKINELYEAGNTVYFLTARGMGRSNNEEPSLFENLTQKQLQKWGVKHHDLFMGKPAGDLYIDDKGIKDEDFFSN